MHTKTYAWRGCRACVCLLAKDVLHVDDQKEEVLTFQVASVGACVLLDYFGAAQEDRVRAPPYRPHIYITRVERPTATRTIPCLLFAK
jgi:hypothetical protein